MVHNEVRKLFVEIKKTRDFSGLDSIVILILECQYVLISNAGTLCTNL